MRGPMSSPAQPSGTSTPSSSRRSVSASNERPEHQVHGQHEFARRVLARAPGSPPASSTPSSSTRESPVAIPWAREEAEAHRSAHQHLVSDLQEPLHDADLVGDLGAAEHHAEGAGGIVADGGQLPDLALEQQARVGGKQVRHSLGGGVGPMGGAEGVVHVQIGERRQPPGQLRVVARLARLEAAVLEHQHVARARAVEPCARPPGPTTAGASATSEPSNSTEPRRDRGHRERRVDSLRPPQVRDEHQRRAALAQQLDGRQRAANPRVVLDLAVGERDVEVDPHQHPLPLHGCIPDARLVEAQRGPDRRRLRLEHLRGQLDAAVRVAPLVVVPGDHLDQPPVDHHRLAGVEDRRVRVLDDVGGDDRVLGVGEDALAAARRPPPWRRR